MSVLKDSVWRHSIIMRHNDEGTLPYRLGDEKQVARKKFWKAENAHGGLWPAQQVNGTAGKQRILTADNGTLWDIVPAHAVIHPVEV